MKQWVPSVVLSAAVGTRTLRLCGGGTAGPTRVRCCHFLPPDLHRGILRPSTSENRDNQRSVREVACRRGHSSFTLASAQRMLKILRQGSLCCSDQFSAALPYLEVPKFGSDGQSSPETWACQSPGKQLRAQSPASLPDNVAMVVRCYLYLEARRGHYTRQEPL